MLEIKVRTEEDGSRFTELTCEGETEEVLTDTVCAAAAVIDYMVQGNYVQATTAEILEAFGRNLQNVLNDEAERRLEEAEG